VTALGGVLTAGPSELEPLLQALTPEQDNGCQCNQRAS